MSPTPSQPLPVPTPESAPFWEGTRAGELRLPRCAACNETFFPPQPTCPRCVSDDVGWIVASGRGQVYSCVISHLSPPGFPPPTTLALIDLDEGPRLLSRLVDVPPNRENQTMPLLDARVEVVFDEHDEVTLPLFRLTEPKIDVAEA